MRLLPIEYVKLNQKLGVTLLDRNNNTLLKQGTVITEKLLDRIRSNGYYSLYVSDDDVDELPDELIPAKLKHHLIEELHNLYKSVHFLYRTHKARRATSSHHMHKLLSRRDKVIGNIVELTDDLIHFLIHHRPEYVELMELKTLYEYEFQHSIQVAVLAVLLSVRLKFPIYKIRAIALASLLKDVGEVSIPEEVLNKHGRYNEKEKELVFQHPSITYECIHNCSFVNSYTRLICLQHHERLDGSGYPKGLCDTEIHDLTKVVSIADGFDALTSDRPFRRAYPQHKALEIMERSLDIEYDRNMFNVFKSMVARFPTGSHVALSTYDYAVVVAQSSNPAKPRISLLNGANTVVDLTKVPHINITGLKYTE